MICPVCGQLNLPGTEQCSNCLFDLMAIDRPIPTDRVEASLLRDPVSVLEPKPPVTVNLDATLGEAIAKMLSRSVGALLVLDAAGGLAGILTERDFLTKVAGAADFASRPVRDYMTPRPETAALATPSPSPSPKWTAAATATSPSPPAVSRSASCPSATCSGTWCICADEPQCLIPTVVGQVFFADLIRGHEPVLLFIGDQELAVLLDQFEHHDGFAGLVLHELHGDQPRGEQRKRLPAQGQVLHHLHDPDLVAPPFGLHGDDELVAGVVDRDVDFVDFDLAKARQRSSPIQLNRCSNNTEEPIEDAVVTDLCQQQLLLGDGKSQHGRWGFVGQREPKVRLGWDNVAFLVWYHRDGSLLLCNSTL